MADRTPLLPGNPARVIPVTAVVLRDADDVLLVRKRGTRAWIFPGGKPEPGETPAETGAREVQEELGLTLAPDALRLLGEYHVPAANETGFAVHAHVFLVPGAAAGDGTALRRLRAAAEIEELAWWPAGAAAADLAPLTSAVLAELFRAGGGRMDP